MRTQSHGAAQSRRTRRATCWPTWVHLRTRRLSRSACTRHTAAATAAQAVDFVGADLSVSVLAALRFELPWKNLRDIGIFGHVFANGAGMSLLGGSGSGSGSGSGGGSRGVGAGAGASLSRGGAIAAAGSLPRPFSSSSSFPLAGAVAAAAGELCSTWRWSAVS